MATKEIPVNYDIKAHPDADEFDPEAWFEGTGEDVGLPAGYVEKDAAAYQRALEDERRRRESAKT